MLHRFVLVPFFVLASYLYQIMTSQKPPLSGPTRRRYLPRMASMFALMAATLIPTSFDKSAFDIYGSSITKRRMEILFSVNLSARFFSVSIIFSDIFSVTFSATFGTVIFRMNSSVLKDGTFAPLASCSRQIRSKPSPNSLTK